jgi:sporulation protein YlmC with PRC-barrel domain
MEVLTSDGTSLGKVKEVYVGTEPSSPFEQCDDETTVEVQQGGGLFSKGVTMYIPCRAVGGVSGNSVTLNVDSETANSKGWTHRPSWIQG